ncbi:MAG: hybrid sensor histidine kinase/response regulator [Verrucomicrobiales bacterium]|nr:hybrid sensor histidine kinase/response regulator [Verrucomicrobiales bacterium]
MENLYDYKKFAILYVDDEEKSLKYFARAFGDEFRVFTAANAQDGFKLLEQHADEIGLLLTDQRMPGETGVWLLERARQLRPHILRILVTAYSDFDAAIAAVNSGAIYKYVHKPWDPPQLELTLRQALEFFMVQTERDQLLLEKMSVLRNMMIADRIVSLGMIAAGLSHHIKNSMVAVKTFLEMAPIKMSEEKASSSSLRDPDFWRDYHQNAQNQIEKINNLLGDLRTSADNNAATQFADEVSLSTAVGAALEMFKDQFAARKIAVDNTIPDALPALHVDKAKFYRLFELLLKDELAMLPAGSKISLSAELQKAGTKPEIIVQICDNGPGLPQEALNVIFDPFVVSSGTPSEYGINLMACFFIVHHHGGKIEAKNLPGGGNTFTICLPLQPETTVASPDETAFLKKALLNEGIWEKLLSGG